MQSLSEIFEKILTIEDELRLFEKTIDGVRFWEYIRAPLILSISEKVASHGVSRRKGPSFLDRIRFLIISIVRFWKNPIFARRRDILFIAGPRRILRKDGYWWDIINDYIIENIDLSYIAIEHNFNLQHRNPPKTSNLWYFDFQTSLIYIAEKMNIFQISLSDEDKVLLRELREEIARSCGVDFDVKKLTLMHLGYRRLRIPYFRFVLRRIRPKIMILVTSYGKEDLIETAKSQHIPVIELQHGVINRFHPGYSFPGRKYQKKTFPDWLLTFGDYWSKGVEYSIPDQYIVSAGFPHLDEERRTFSNLKKKKQILVISEGPIGEALSKFTAELSRVKDLGYNIVYKLHPAEQREWQYKYPWLIDTDVKVIDNPKISLYKLFAESEIQIGVASTAIFEGLAFGLNTYVPDIFGSEYMEQLVEDGVAVRISTVQELVDHLRSNDAFNKFESERYFRSGAIDRILDLLLEIIKKKNNAR